ncbi:hypothetical protein BC829DRAFT_386481 [Chytridium lagenaria]|nr:hypothetical protein BC829DRAFT_386481 [Chytridium lagenaria]
MPSVEYRPANHDSRGRHRSQPDGNMPSVEYRPANHDSRGRTGHRSQPDGNMPSVEYRPANQTREVVHKARNHVRNPRSTYPSLPTRPPRDDPRSQPPPDTDYQNYNNRSDSRGRGRSQNPLNHVVNTLTPPTPTNPAPIPSSTRSPIPFSWPRKPSQRTPSRSSRIRPYTTPHPPGTAATSAGASVNIPTRTNIIAGSDWFRTEGGQHQLREGNAAYPEVEGYRKFEKGAADLKGNPKKLKQMFPELSPMEIL